jgi:hypothetical protein
MIDKTSRLKAASLLHQFRRGNITNDKFVRAFPRSNDAVLRAIEQMAWFCYSDLREHRLTGRNALNPEWQQLFDRCVLFLNTRIEYSGSTRFISLATPFKRLGRWLIRRSAPGFPPWWPFTSREQFENYGRSSD